MNKDKLIALPNGESIRKSTVCAIRIGEIYPGVCADRVIIDHLTSSSVIYFESAEEAKAYAIELRDSVNG